MATIIDDLKARYKNGDLLMKLIFINAAVFVLLGVFRIVSHLFKLGDLDLSLYLSVPSSPEALLVSPWTILTYMFVHVGIWHILFNMLVFYWFGRLFLMYFSERNLMGLYILGGICGALVYILAFQFIPVYAGRASLLMGASAAVMAIVFGISFYQPNEKVNMLFVGQIKIVYIAIAMFIIDFISLDDMANPGGHLAHIGGAAIGLLFAVRMKNGKDITAWINRIGDFFVNLFSSLKFPRKNPMKVTYKRTETDYDYNQKKHNQEAEIDKILDKLKRSGYSSLSSDEKKKLFDASKK
ncbi:MAG: rhomboid family intramembrane serine protease [Dysgonamonadaceae bacterium]